VHSVESVTVLDVYYHDDDDAPRRIYIHIYRYIYYYASWIEVDALWIVEGGRKASAPAAFVYTQHFPRDLNSQVRSCRTITAAPI
jgi:hypothetical protein